MSGRILLVEDNPQVADVTAQMLTAMGFQVEATDRARKALERLDAGTTGIDLLLTDVVMPDGLNGVDLATLIRARFPTLPIILTSGYNDVGRRRRVSRAAQAGSVRRTLSCDLRRPEEGTRQRHA